jgi:TIR domain
MRASDRISIIDKIGRELQSRFRYEEIDTFLGHYGVSTPSEITTNSKWVYSKDALRNVETETLLKIAEELGVAVPSAVTSSSIVPRNWQGTTTLRLFISHISIHKVKATRLKSCLELYAISGFVAHEDIVPTLEWQSEIERALYAMDAFIAILTPGFSQSIWTQQEIGFAYARGVKIISLKMGEDPTGFISKQQALPRRDRSAEEIAKEVDAILSADERTATKLLSAKKARGLKTLKDEIPF